MMPTSSRRPAAEHVGIRGLYVYFPRLMVQQQDLEAADGCAGKYTSGLGQQQMTFCGDREDVVSMAATAVLTLLEQTGVQPTDIGRLEVGTETGVDRSKSVMSYLVHYLNAAGNYTVQGADHMHGCYGGTSALSTVADWVASPSWDGRLGLVVATDIAVYPPGSPARPTGGCGAAAMLVGPDAPLVIQPWPWRAAFSAHTYDFFKPHGHPLYPVVDGPATLLWFTKAADACAAQLHTQLQQHGLLAAQQQQQQQQQQGQQGEASSSSSSSADLGLLSSYDFFLSHAPFNKLVRKVFARLVLHDGLLAAVAAGRDSRATQADTPQQKHQQQQQQQQQAPDLSNQLQHSLALAGAPPGQQPSCSNQQEPHRQQQHQQQRPQLPPLPDAANGLVGLLQSLGPSPPGATPQLTLPDSSITDKELERALLASSSELYEHMASAAASLQCQLGNLYTASLYSGLASLLAAQGGALAGKRLLCFSFGSGVVASMFTLTGRECGTASSQQVPPPMAAASTSQQQQSWQDLPCSLQGMADQLRLPQRLASRMPCSVGDFDAAMSSLRAAYDTAPYTPSYGSAQDLAPGTVHLTGIDSGFKRSYERC